MNKLFSKLNLKVAGSIFAVLTLALIFAPRSTNIAKSESCPNPPTYAVLNYWPVSFGSTAGYNCTDFTPIAGHVINGSNYPASQQELNNGVTANTGDELYVRIYIHDGAAQNLDPAQTTARNIQVSTSVDTSVGTNHIISTSFGGSNTNTVFGSFTVHTPSGSHLEVVPSSGEIFDYQANVIASGLNIGNNTYNLGDMQACFEFSKFIRFKVKVVGQVVVIPSGTLNMGQLQSDTNSCTFSGTLSWAVQNVNNAVVTEIAPGGSEQDIASSGSNGGSRLIQNLQPNKTYVFNLYSTDTGSRVKLASINVGTPSLNCNQPQPLNCYPSTQSANVNQLVYFTASGGPTNTYAWSAPGATQTSGTGVNFSTSYSSDTPPNKTVTVSNGGQTATCSVLINTQPPICTINTNPSISNTGFTLVSGNTFSTTIQYSFSGNNPVKITYVDPVDFQEKIFVDNTTASGSQIFNQIQAGRDYVFKMYDKSSCGGLLTFVVIRKDVTSCVFNSNYFLNVSTPSRSGTSGAYSATLTWGSTGSNQIKITVNGSGTVLTTGSASGSYSLTNLQPGLAYTYYMYDVECNVQLTYTTVYVPADTPVIPPYVSPTYNNCVNNSCNYTNNTTNTNYSNNTYVPPTYYPVTYNQPTYYPPVYNPPVQQVLGSSVNLSFSKKAFNDTKNSEATAVAASREDFITYTLTVTNNGNAPSVNYSVTDDLSGVFPYADMVDNGGGVVNGSTLTYSSLTVPAYGSVSRSFKVRVKYALSSTQSYIMSNTYGNTINININRVVAPQVQGAFVAPRTGAETSAFWFAGLATAAFALYRKKNYFLKLILG